MFTIFYALQEGKEPEVFSALGAMEFVTECHSSVL